ncbi:MAG TPA: glycosyltransferase family 4 protein [bacterium]|nr:glycosyltransferase family 4 protein [bacterium]
MTHRLSIAQICSSRSWGGMEMHVLFLSEQLRQAGLNATVWCAPDSELSRHAARSDLAVFNFEPRGYFNPYVLYKSCRQLRKKPPDLLHVHFGKDLWTLVPALHGGCRIPIVFTKHIGTQKSKRDPLHRYLYRHVCRLIAVSQVIGKNLLDTHPVQAGQIEIIHHGVDVAHFQDPGTWRDSIRREWGIHDDHFLIGTIGRLQDGKGHLEFLDMAAEIGRRFPFTRFVIVGEPTRGEEYRAQSIYDKIKSLHLQDKVLLPGFRADIPAVLAALDLFAFPSRAEAFGLVLIEAMAAGKPVISTRCDGVLDIVRHEENGLLFDANRVEAFIQSVQRMLEQPSLRERLARQALQTVVERFSRERFLSRIIDLYDKCLAQG